MNFSETFKDALQKRLYPYTNLRQADFAYALGAHTVTVRSWLRGENAPSGPMVAAAVDFFTRHGDHGFFQELFPQAVEPLVRRNAEADKALRLVQGLKEFLTEGAAA